MSEKGGHCATCGEGCGECHCAEQGFDAEWVEPKKENPMTEATLDASGLALRVGDLVVAKRKTSVEGEPVEVAGIITAIHPHADRADPLIEQVFVMVVSYRESPDGMWKAAEDHSGLRSECRPYEVRRLVTVS